MVSGFSQFRSISWMRTTLNIAEDVLLAAKAIGRFEQKSAEQVISELARKGLHPARTLASDV
jgi:hypothetical protein